MSKILSGFLLAGLLSLSAQADALRIEMGGGVWNNEVSGPITYQGLATYNAEDLGYSDENRAYLWLNIKHPIPILPNLRLEYANVDFSGSSTQPFQYNGIEFNVDTKSDTGLAQYDAVLYYNILDNTMWTTFDLGIDIKYIDAKFDAVGTGTPIGGGTASPQSVSEGEKLILPLGYARLRFDLPFNLGIESDIKYIKYKSSGVTDFRVKADYLFTDLLPFDFGVEVGYRFENIKIDQDDFSSFDVDADLDIKGIFAGAVVKF